MPAVVAVLLTMPGGKVLAVTAVLLFPCVLLCVLAFQESKPNDSGNDCQGKPDRRCDGDKERVAELREKRICLDPEHDEEHRQEANHADAETESTWVSKVIASRKAVEALRCEHREERRGDEAYDA